MAQPRKYSTDADRFRAYRERKKERVEALAREVENLGRKSKRSATVGDGSLRRKVRDLHHELVKRRGKATAKPELVALLDYVENELNRLLQ